jgi:hypothetical protein
MFLLLEDELNITTDITLTDKHLNILEQKKEKHASGQSASYSWDEAKAIIKGTKKLR